MIRRLVSLVFLLGIACSTSAPPIPPAAPAFELEQVQRTAPGCVQPASECTRVDLSWPQFEENTPLGRSLNAWNRRFLASAPSDLSDVPTAEQVADGLIAEYLGFKRNVPDSQVPYTVERSVAVLYADDHVVTLKGLDASFTGGAHGNESVALASIDRKDGRTLSAADLFGTSPSQELMAIVEHSFQTARNLSREQSLADAGFAFDNDRFTLPRALGLGRDGVEFCFNAYEVAPYAMGPTSFVVPYAQVRGFIAEPYRP